MTVGVDGTWPWGKPCLKSEDRLRTYLTKKTCHFTVLHTTERNTTLKRRKPSNGNGFQPHTTARKYPQLTGFYATHNPGGTSRALPAADEAKASEWANTSAAMRRWQRPSPLSAAPTSPRTVGSHQASGATMFARGKAASPPRYELSFSRNQPKTLENTTFSRVFPFQKSLELFRKTEVRTDLGQTLIFLMPNTLLKKPIGVWTPRPICIAWIILLSEGTFFILYFVVHLFDLFIQERL